MVDGSWLMAQGQERAPAPGCGPPPGGGGEKKGLCGRTGGCMDERGLCGTPPVFRVEGGFFPTAHWRLKTFFLSVVGSVHGFRVAVDIFSHYVLLCPFFFNVFLLFSAGHPFSNVFGQCCSVQLACVFNGVVLVSRGLLEWFSVVSSRISMVFCCFGMFFNGGVLSFPVSMDFCCLVFVSYLLINQRMIIDSNCCVFVVGPAIAHLFAAQHLEFGKKCVMRSLRKSLQQSFRRPILASSVGGSMLHATFRRLCNTVIPSHKAMKIISVDLS